jgi:hypothetical protein
MIASLVKIIIYELDNEVSFLSRGTVIILITKCSTNKILGSHGDEHDNDSVLGYCAV